FSSRRRHTRSKRDWSSDVCSSDLRPVFLLHAEGHYAWVNSKALEMAGITSQTDHPEYGIIYKDKVGDPTGILIEAAISLVGEFAYHFTKEDRKSTRLNSSHVSISY